MDPDDLSDDQIMRLITLGIAALSGVNSTLAGLCRSADVLARYVETGEHPEA